MLRRSVISILSKDSIQFSAKHMTSSLRWILFRFFVNGPTISVTPSYSLFDDDALNISVSGFRSHEKVTLHSCLIEKDVTFSAVGHYVTDVQGQVKTRENSSVGGSFSGVEPLGLMWSMELAPGQRSGLRLIKSEVTKPFKISIGVHRGHLDLEHIHCNLGVEPVASQTFDRGYMAPGVKRIPVEHGTIRGTMFIPSGPGPFPAVVDVYGFIRGINETRSALFASHGIASLALPYFHYKDLPRPTRVEEFNLDYFEEAVDFLFGLSETKKKGVGVIGNSKGCDLSLAMAEFFPKVKAVVPVNGACFSTFGDLRYKGKIVKHRVEPDFSKLIPVGHVGGELFSMTNIFPEEIEDDRMLHIEKSQADFLFITGLDDRTRLPKVPSAGRRRLQRFGKTNFEHLEYPNTGHIMEPPYTPHVPYTYNIFPNGTSCYIDWGGTKSGYAQAQKDFWNRVLKFFKEKL